MAGPNQQEPLKLHPIFLKRDLSTFEENLRQTLAAKAPEPRKEMEPTGPDLISRLPLELLGMILSWLPVDSLFRAARVSKHFRRVLLSRERAWIWRAARREQGWDDLETRDFDELQYAKYVTADECMVCRADEVSIERWAEHRVALCESAIAIGVWSGRYCAQGSRTLTRKPYDAFTKMGSKLRPRAREAVRGAFTGERRNSYFVPDILEQTAKLCQIEASAIRNGADAVAAVASYIEDRRPSVEASARDAAMLFDSAEDCYEDDFDRKRQFSHDLCAFRLHQMGYDYIDYAPIFEEQVWWCWCERFRDENCPEYDSPALLQAISKLDWYHAVLDQGEDEDELFDRAFKAIEAEHAKCIIPTWDYWKYWHGQDKSARNDEYYADRPLRAEWDELSEIYIAFTQQRRSSRLLSAFIGRCEATLTALIYRSVERGPELLAKIDSVSSELAILHNLKINSNAELEPLSDVSPDESFEQHLEEKVHLDKIRIFLRIAEALLHDGDPVPELAKRLAQEARSASRRYAGVGFVQANRELSDHDLDPILARATALLRCGFCARKLPFDEMRTHLLVDHEAGPTTSFAHVLSASFRRLVRDLLAELGLPLTTTHDQLKDNRYVVVERLPSGVSWTSFGQRWDQVLAGLADDNLPRARRLVDGNTTGREIISIKLDHQASLQP